MITINPTIPGGSDTVFGVDATVTTTGAYNGGVSIDGQRYIIAPASVKLASSSPAQATVDGRVGNGMQANLVQGGLNALDAGTTYDGSAALAVDTVVQPGSCIVKVESSNPRDASSGSAGREGLFEATTVVQIVPSARAANAIAPVVWPSSDLANRPWRVADVDGVLAGLPVLASSGAPTWASIAAFWDKLDFGLAWAQGIRYQWLAPRRVANENSSYGQYRAAITGQVWAGLCGNEWSTGDKTAALIRALSNGCQTVEAYNKTGLAITEDGGQFQWHLPECLAWIKATGQTANYAALSALVGANVRNQYYQMATGYFNPHDSALLPYISRRRTVSAITGSGPYVVTCTGYRPGSGLTGDTASNSEFVDLNMVRESNGAVSLITAKATTGADWNFTVATLPTGLVTGNVIYCAPVTPLANGVWDWTARNPVDFPNLPNPAPNAEYRSNNNHGNSILPISALGMRGANLTPAKEYVERITASAAYAGGFQQTFWSTHQATVLALPQIV